MITCAHGGKAQLTNTGGGGEYVWVELKGNCCVRPWDPKIQQQGSKSSRNTQWENVGIWKRLTGTLDLIGEFSFLWKDKWKTLHLVSISSAIHMQSQRNNWGLKYLISELFYRKTVSVSVSRKTVLRKNICDIEEISFCFNGETHSKVSIWSSLNLVAFSEKLLRSQRFLMVRHMQKSQFDLCLISLQSQRKKLDIIGVTLVFFKREYTSKSLHLIKDICKNLNLISLLSRRNNRDIKEISVKIMGRHAKVSIWSPFNLIAF